MITVRCDFELERSCCCSEFFVACSGTKAGLAIILAAFRGIERLVIEIVCEAKVDRGKDSYMMQNGMSVSCMSLR